MSGSMGAPSLTWRCGALLLIAQGFALLAMFWGLRVAAERAAVERGIREMQSLVAPLTRAYAATDNPGSLGPAVRRDASALHAHISILSPDGRRIIVDSHQAGPSRSEELLAPEIAAAARDGSGVVVRRSRVLRKESVYAAGRGPDGRIVRAGRPLDSFMVSPSWWWIGVGGVGVLAIGAGVMAGLGRRLRSSIAALAADVQRFVSGDLSHRVGAPRETELAPLIETMNRTADRLGRHISELQSKRNENEAILRSMAGGVIALDLDQRVLHLNKTAETMLGVRYAKARGRLLQEIVRLPELNRLVEDALTESDHRSDEFELHTDRTSVIRANCTTLRDDRGLPGGILIFLTDVTQLRRLESIRTDFAANVSHELRTPITNIKGYVETLLESDIRDPEQVEQFLGTIQRNTDRLNAIIEDMLALTRLERLDGLSDLTTAPTHFREVISNVLAQLGPEAEHKSMSLVADAPDGLRGDVNARLIEQAISNLVANAIRYSPPETTVTIRTRRASPESEGGIVISVEDEGPGISPEHIPRLFERFYRIDKARSRHAGGTGLGLAIVKHIALVHGGRVEVNSEVGCGSAFRIVLPQG